MLGGFGFHEEEPLRGDFGPSQAADASATEGHDGVVIEIFLDLVFGIKHLLMATIKLIRIKQRQPNQLPTRHLVDFL